MDNKAVTVPENSVRLKDEYELEGCHPSLQRSIGRRLKYLDMMTEKYGCDFRIEIQRQVYDIRIDKQELTDLIEYMKSGEEARVVERTNEFRDRIRDIVWSTPVDVNTQEDFVSLFFEEATR